MVDKNYKKELKAFKQLEEIKIPKLKKDIQRKTFKANQEKREGFNKKAF